jgi:1-acyl-sn-glycerol-3-phosphate acyltransferase
VAERNVTSQPGPRGGSNTPVPRGPLERFLHGALVGACFVFFWFGGAVLSWVILSFTRWRRRAAPPLDRIRACQDVVSRGFVWFTDAMRVLRLVHFDSRTVPRTLPDGPFVMVANHPTLIDVTALIATWPRLCCVAKSPLFRSPMVGRLLRHSGHIQGGDAGAMDGAAVMQQALDRLASGLPVLIFPEGTRSPPGGLHGFKRGALEIACRANVPVVPVFITCDPPTLMKGVPWYALPKTTSRYDLWPLPPVPVDTFASSRAATTYFQDLFRRRLEEWLPGATPSGAALQTHTSNTRAAVR